MCLYSYTHSMTIQVKPARLSNVEVVPDVAEQLPTIQEKLPAFRRPPRDTNLPQRYKFSKR